jgi:hypothetical protein
VRSIKKPLVERPAIKIMKQEDGIKESTGCFWHTGIENSF